jgi:hypothetical protein
VRPGAFVHRWSGRVFEGLAARYEHRETCDLYHAALEVRLDGDRFVIEMAPAWGSNQSDRRVVAEAPSACRGSVALGTSDTRYAAGATVSFPICPRLSQARDASAPIELRRRQLLDLVPAFRTVTWGRDELRTGEMWNSNSLISWLLHRTGHDSDRLNPPERGRAPGWSAGVVVAAREMKPTVTVSVVARGQLERPGFHS